MKLLAFPALALVACAPQPPLSAGPSGKCSIVRLGKFIGKTLTVDIIHQAMKRAGVTNSRGISPGQAVTMDYREDRLNIYTDAKGNISRFTCG
jgi:hypothetical protein